jgi:hypothetical protein
MFSYIGHAHHFINLLTTTSHKMSSHEKVSVVLRLPKFFSLAQDIIVSDLESHISGTGMAQTWIFISENDSQTYMDM